MPKQLPRSLTTILALLTLVAMQSLHADWDLNFGGISATAPQDVVVSLATDPNHDPEAACLAVTFARSLSGNPKANITLFVTLDGVNLASEDYITRKRLKEYECTTPSGKISLVDHLTAYIAGNDSKMMVCPICWKERYEDEVPDYGDMPGVNDVPGTAIGTMMFNADKILSF
jgi:sulfur relay (sulfurtransferase) complex TusBCD TusD component (DsrE family)